MVLTPTRVNKPAERPRTGADLPEGEVIYLLLVLAAGAEIISSPAPAGARGGPPRPGGGRQEPGGGAAPRCRPLSSPAGCTAQLPRPAETRRGGSSSGGRPVLRELHRLRFFGVFFLHSGGKGASQPAVQPPNVPPLRGGRAGGLPQRGGPAGGGQPRRHGRPRKCRLDGAGRDRGGAGSGAGQGPRKLRRPRRQQMAAGPPPFSLRPLGVSRLGGEEERRAPAVPPRMWLRLCGSRRGYSANVQAGCVVCGVGVR